MPTIVDPKNQGAPHGGGTKSASSAKVFWEKTLKDENLKPTVSSPCQTSEKSFQQILRTKHASFWVNCSKKGKRES